MAALVAAIHDFVFSLQTKNSWMARLNRAMTKEKNLA
jgi:hypothetical protein